jgi:uncharacterized protein
MTGAEEVFEILDRATCLDLLRTVEVGRLAWIVGDGRVEVRPVTFALAGSDMIMRTGTGSMLAAARAGLSVTFEADDFEPGVKGGWSVLAVGPVEDLPATEAAALGVSVRPWAQGDRPHVLRVRARELTGRRLRPRAGEVIFVHLEPDAE